MIPTCALTVNVSLIAGGVVAGATVRAVLSGPEVYEGIVLADGITAATDGSGNAELELFPNANGLLGSYYALTVEREGLADQVLYIIVPAQPTATLDDCETSRRPFRFTGTSAIPMGGPVTSFNTRRGDIVLTEDDVADALAGVDDAAARPTDADPLLELAAGATPVARAWSDVQAYVLGLPWRMPADTDADVTSFFKAQHDYALAQGLGFVRWKPRTDGKPWRVGMIAWHPKVSIICEGVPRFEAIDNIPLVNIARRVETSPGVYEYQASAPADQRAFIYLLARAPFTTGQSINTPSTEGYKFTISGALIYDGNKGGQTGNGGTTYNPASFIYAERGKNDPDYDEVAAANGDAKAYDCFRLEHVEAYNTSGTPFYGGPDRQRGHISGKCRATGCGVVSAGVVKTEARGYEWRGNDCITDSGFGGGGNTGEGGYFGGNSGAMFVHGNYWNQNPYMPDAATAFTLSNVNGAVSLSNVFNASLVATVSASAANAKKGIAVLGNDCRIADELFLPGRASGDPLGVADISKNAAMVFAGYRQVQCVGNTYSPDKDGKAWAHLVSATDSAGVYASFSATSEPGKSPFAVSPFRAASGASIGYNWFDGYTGLLHLGVTAENTRVRGVQFDTQFGVVSAAPTNLTEGGSYQLGLDVHNVFFSAASPLSAHTFILPKFPVDGRTVKITFDQAIAACTFTLASESTSAGHTIRSGAESFSAGVGDSVEFQYRESVSSKQWRRVAVMRNTVSSESSPVVTVDGIAPDGAGNVQLLGIAKSVAEALDELTAIATAPGAAMTYAIELLDDAERAEVRDDTSLPTINIGAKLQAWLDAAYLLYGTGSPRKGSQGCRMLFHAGQYLMNGLQVKPGMGLVGLSSRYEVRLLQTATARQPMIDVLGRTSAPEGTQRRTDVFLQDLFIKCNGLAALDASPINGIWLRPEDLETDEANRTGVIAHRVQCAGASGSGFYSEKRGRNWLHECQFTGNGEKGLFIQGPDCLLVKVYCGENGKEQMHIKSSATPMIDHLELGPGSNPQLYPALYVENCTDFVINGGNCTGWVKVEGGEGDPTSYDHGLHIRGTIANVIFTFKEKSFTDPSDVYSDLNGYIWVKNSRGLSVKNCMFRPAEVRLTDGGTGAVSYRYQYRPLNIVYIQGADSFVSFDCPLPSLTDPLWPAGTPAQWPGSAPTNTYDSITNQPDRALLMFTDPTPGASAWVANRLRVLSGIAGASGASSVPAGNIGELVSVETETPASLTTATISSLASITVPAGHWSLYGAVVFTATAATVSSAEAGISSNNSSISTASPKRYAGEYIGCTTYTGPASSLQIGPYNLNSDAPLTRYLNARASFSAGSVSVSGVIEARRAG